MKLMATLSALVLSCSVLHATDRDFRKAVDLYGKGLYSSAMDMLQSLPQAGDDPLIDGYTVLCAQKMHLEGYEGMVEAYLKEYPSGMLKNDIIREAAYDRFDKKEYLSALELFEPYPTRHLPKKEKAMFLYKRAYCLYRVGKKAEAMSDFLAVSSMEIGDYSAPSWYCIAYIKYNDGEFADAVTWFAKAATDERFRPISKYYSVICRYQMKEYDKVIEAGTELFNTRGIDPQRKNYLAKLISESFLIRGDKKKAKEFYDEAGDETTRSRQDYFYSGCLMFATEDYKSAIENYRQVTDKADSLAQIAWYNSALSHIELKNKVEALTAFSMAAGMDFDGKMTEDAFFNWAKLAFDINRDTSVFGKYLARYSDKVRGEMIYSYMALSALADKDWQAAINHYDKIENLSEKDQNNFVRANYLRGCQLLDNGSYRSAIPFLQTVDFSTPKDDRLNQLARLYLSMAQYRNSQWDMAASGFTSLYNASALFGMEENDELAYYAAYSYFKKADYANADKWFTSYIGQAEAAHKKDAMTRRADCRYMRGEYLSAAECYGQISSTYRDANDIYPYFYQAVCFGLAKKKKEKIEALKLVDSAQPKAAMYSEALFELAKAYQEDGKVDEAAKTFRKLIANAPDSVYQARSFLELGTLKRNAGFPDAALECYKTVVEKYRSCGFSEDALLAIESVYNSMRKPALFLRYLESIGHGSDRSEADKEKMIFEAAEQIFYSGDFTGAVAALKEFKDTYGESSRRPQADYLMAKSYEKLGDKVHAADFFHSAALHGDTLSFASDAWKCCADLNLSMENYADAKDAYSRLLSKAGTPAGRLPARTGLMRSQWLAKEYEGAVTSCDSLVADKEAGQVLLREAKLVKAKSLLSLSRRDEALPILESLAAAPRSDEGAEATYLLARHHFDKAEYDNLITMVKKFAASGTENEYYLAKCFIIMGDCFVEQGKLKQAQATYQSIADGYSGSDDEITAELAERLSKLKKEE